MKLPKSWKDVTIRHYTEIQALDGLDLIDYEVAKLAILTGLPTEEIEKLNTTAFKEAARSISFLNTLPKTGALPSKVKIKGKRFKVTVFYKDMTAAQLIDSLTFAKRGGNPSDLMAVFLTPKKFPWSKSAYDGRTHEERSKFLYENMPMSMVHPISVFFSQVFHSLPGTILHYLEQELKRANLTEEEQNLVLQIVGDGSPLSTILPTV